MPELPEVETIKNGLKLICQNRSIAKSQIHTYQLRYPVLPNLSNLITKHKILDLQRRAKYIIFKLDNGCLLFHLGMAGRMYATKQYHKNNHEHLTLYLDSSDVISFCDPRRFGAIIWISHPIEKHPLIQNLGVEPFSEAFRVQHLYSSCLKRKISIKQLLMEGKTVAGIGNIYASEILFYSGIKPDRITNTISLDECKKMHKYTKFVLAKAIKAGGTTIRDFRNPKSGLGYFSQQLAVYGRLGENCIKCHEVILRIIQNKRSSFYCSICQV